MYSLHQAIYFVRLEVMAWEFLHVEGSIITAIFLSSRCPISTRLFLVKISHEIILKCMVIEEHKDERQDNCECFFQTSNISQPVKHIVSFSIDSIQIQVKFEHDSMVCIIWVLIRSYGIRPDVENRSFNFCDWPELYMNYILQLELLNLDRIGNFLS